MSSVPEGLSPILVEHASAPRNRGPLPRADGYARLKGSCGDTIEVWLRCRDGRIMEPRFATDGCGPSLAAGSMATELAKGLPLEEALEIGGGEIDQALGGMPEEVRHCAALAADTLHAACRDVMRGGEEAAAERQRRKAAMDGAKARLVRRLEAIRHTVLVLSGKGGVGKSTVAVQLAVAAARAGLRVGVLDVDIYGPSVPSMLGVEGAPLMVTDDSVVPVEAEGVKIVSMGFLLGGRDEAAVWRGPAVAKVIEQFLRDVEWGELDLLVVDAPPGTGDEPLSVCQLVRAPDGAVIVTTPQDVAIAAVRRSLAFCRRLALPVLGVVENMSGFVCPTCGDTVPVFGSGAGRRMASEVGVPFLGSVPIIPEVTAACDGGYVADRDRGWVAAEAFDAIAAPIVELASADRTAPERVGPDEGAACAS